MHLHKCVLCFKVLRASVVRLLQHVEALSVNENHLLKLLAAQLSQSVTDLQVRDNIMVDLSISRPMFHLSSLITDLSLLLK